MTGTFSILVLGLFLGMKHATEADHLSAVATLVAGQNSLAQTVRLGVAWGIGHTLMLMSIGGLVLWLGSNIPARLEQALELMVSLMLVALGADLLRRLARQRIHFHAHRHGGAMHVHAHSHAGETSTHHVSPHDHPHHDQPPLRALAVGMMHGMAGSAALVALSLGAVSSWPMGLLYIAVFGVGSIVGMALLSIAISIPMRWSSLRLGQWLHNGIKVLVGGSSCALGGFMFYRIGILDGLLLNLLGNGT